MYHFNKVDTTGFIARMMMILNNEGVSFTADVLLKYIQTYYPDLRACINALTQHIKGNVLEALGGENYSVDKFTSIIRSFKTDTILNTKKLLVESLSVEDYTVFYQFLYNHLEMITENKSLWDDVILKISEYLYKHETMAFPDINLMACLIDLKKIIG
jgi:DNA polymerase III delta prime subunit